MIDGFMATANVPFLNNLCCYRHGRPPYNGSYFYNLLHDQYFKRLRASANELLNKVSGGFETIIASVLTIEGNREITNTGIYISFGYKSSFHSHLVLLDGIYVHICNMDQHRLYFILKNINFDIVHAVVVLISCVNVDP